MYPRRYQLNLILVLLPTIRPKYSAVVNISLRIYNSLKSESALELCDINSVHVQNIRFVEVRINKT